MAEVKQIAIPHKITLEDRKLLSVTGVCEVVSFDDVSVRLKTSKGELDIEGTELHISALDTSSGAVTVNGNINSLEYFEETKKFRFGKNR